MNLKTKISIFVESIKSEGYVIAVLERSSDFELVQYNCPLSIISENYKEACKYEIELYRELFGQTVRRTRCSTDGDNYCAYVIPK